MTLKVYSPTNEPIGFLNNVFDLKITKEISGIQELSFYVPIDSQEAGLIELEGYIYPEGEQLFVIRELNQHGNDIEVYCTLAIENLYGYCWGEISREKSNLVEAFEYVIQHTGWKFVNRTTTPARIRDIYIQNQTVWEALQVLCEVYFVEMEVDVHTHTITAYDKVGKDNGTFFISDLNLVNFRKDSSTHKLITRLIPVGKDGLTITSVNEGKNYIDNNTYSKKLLYGMWVQTAYTSPSELKEDATKWLEEYSKPFISYNIDIIDLYRKDGNPYFEFNIGDTVTIIDKLSEEKVQQRVVKMTIYPHKPQMNSIELSNKNKTFQDYFKMIQLMNNMANHFIQTNGSATGTGSTNSTSTAVVGADSVGSSHIKADSITTKHLQANSVTTEKLVANSITTDKLQANSVTTDKLVANSVTSNKIVANAITTHHLQSNIIDTDKLCANAINAEKIQASAISTDKLQANSISTDKLQANSVTAEKIKASNIKAEHIQAGAIVSDKIGANAIEAKHIKAGVIDSQHINAGSIDAEHLQANIITSEHIQTGAITAGSGIIADGAIGNAQISSVNANKINAGEIDTSKVKVKGENGFLFIENNTLFVVDNNRKIRCELGVIENNSNYGFIVRGADGKTIMLDHNGVHNAGITDGAIDNRKVSENANISGKKLDIDSVVRTINEDGSVTIQGTKVQVGNATLDVELSKQTNLINEHTTKLASQQASINANTNSIKLKVDSQTYTVDKNNMTTQLNKNTSAISVLEKEIDLKVEQTDIQTAIDGVQVGGRNYALGTADTTPVTGNNTTNQTTLLYNLSSDISALNGNMYTTSFTYKVTNYVGGNFFLQARATPYCRYSGTITPTGNGTFTHTYTIKGLDNLSKALTMGIRMDNFQGTVEVSNLKIELGNKPSSWTPAPEDVDAKITESITEAKAELKITTDSIKQSVSNVQTTTTTLQNNLNNTTNKLNTLTVGSRNLIANSAPTDTKGWTRNPGWTVSLVDCSTAPFGKATRATATVAGSTMGMHKPPVDRNKFINNAEYTISAWIRASKQMSMNFRQETMSANNFITVTTEWKYFTFTQTINTSAQYCSNVFYVTADSNIAVGDWFEVHSLKLEKGNKASDWTPAPDEVQSQLDTNTTEITKTNSKVASVETNLNGITSRVSNVETKTTTIDGKITNHESRITTAEQKITDKAIVNTVSSTIDDKIDKITVGGRNLVRGTDATTEYVGNKGSASYKDVWSGVTTVKMVDTEYIVSFDAKASSEITVACYLHAPNTVTSSVSSTGQTDTSPDGRCRVTVGTSWKRYWVKWKQSSANAIKALIVGRNDSSTNLYIRGVKLECGNKATAWSPAPEDAMDKIDAHYSEFKQTADSITSTVANLNGKYTEIKQTVDSIDLTGKVNFSDLSTSGKTTINGANITTGTMSADRIQGGTIKGALLQTYASDSTKGVRITQESMLLNNTSFFYNTGGNFNIQAKEGFNIASMENIYLMPGLLSSGTPSGNGEVVIPNATLRVQNLNVVTGTTLAGTTTAVNLTASGIIKGKNNITLNRASGMSIPRLGSTITTDYLKLGTSHIYGADNGTIHLIYSSTSNASLSRGSVWLPGANSNVTTDQLAMGGGIMCCVDSGNFHFITKGASASTLYAKNVSASYSLRNSTSTLSDNSALDIVNATPVVSTSEGFRLNVSKARTNNSVVTLEENEITKEEEVVTDYNSAIATMWKAIQELQTEVQTLRKDNAQLKQIISEQGVTVIPE